jgi:hypothetical protein
MTSLLTLTPPSQQKRPYGFITKITNDKWRCFDGTVFKSAYWAYRYMYMKYKSLYLLYIGQLFIRNSF